MHRAVELAVPVPWYPLPHPRSLRDHSVTPFEVSPMTALLTTWKELPDPPSAGREPRWRPAESLSEGEDAAESPGRREERSLQDRVSRRKDLHRERMPEACRKSAWSIMLSTSWHFDVTKLFWARKKHGERLENSAQHSHRTKTVPNRKNFINPWHTGYSIVVPPNPWRIRSKAPKGYLKLQVVAEPQIYYVFSPNIHASSLKESPSWLLFGMSKLLSSLLSHFGVIIK